MNLIRITTAVFVVMLSTSGLVQAKPDNGKSLPPGLQKKVQRGGSLPPGWQKKLAVGEVIEHDIYRHGRIISHDGRGQVTVDIDGEVFRVMENTREIIDILRR